MYIEFGFAQLVRHMGYLGNLSDISNADKKLTQGSLEFASLIVYADACRGET